MFIQKKNFFEKKISLPVVVILLIVTSILTILFKDLLSLYTKEKSSDKFWKEYSYDGILVRKGNLKNGKKIGIWYYYNSYGDLVFIDDMDMKNKNYSVMYWPSGMIKQIFYDIPGYSEVSKVYDSDGTIESLTVSYYSSPHKYINLQINYNKLMNIKDIRRVEFDDFGKR